MTPDHLGGHLNVTHTDPGALAFLQEKFNVKAMLDIGCGPGGMEQIANDFGIEWLGIDGDPSVKKKNTIIHDFTVSPANFSKTFDLGWSVEFLEHVEEKYIGNFMPMFQCCKVVAITHALPRTPGHHHVNCQPPEYWIEKFEQAGFAFLPDVTEEMRARSTMAREFVRNTGMVFQLASQVTEQD